MKTLTNKEFFTLDAIIEAMYAEPGFSDLVAADLFKQINVKWPSVKITSYQSLGGVITQLHDKGIIEMEDWDVWNADEGTYSGQAFIHLAPAYYYLHPEWKDATEVPQARDLVNEHPYLNSLTSLKIQWPSHSVTTEEPTGPSTVTYYQVIDVMDPYGPLNAFRTRDEAQEFKDAKESIRTSRQFKIEPMIVEL